MKNVSQEYTHNFTRYLERINAIEGKEKAREEYNKIKDIFSADPLTFGLKEKDTYSEQQIIAKINFLKKIYNEYNQHLKNENNKENITLSHLDTKKLEIEKLYTKFYTVLGYREDEANDAAKTLVRVQINSSVESVIEDQMKKCITCYNSLVFNINEVARINIKLHNIPYNDTIQQLQQDYIRDNKNNGIPDIYNWISSYKEQAIASEIAFDKLKSQTKQNSINVIPTDSELKAKTSTFQHSTLKIGGIHPKASKDLETYKDAKTLFFAKEVADNHHLTFSSTAELKRKRQKILSFNTSTEEQKRAMQDWDEFKTINRIKDNEQDSQNSKIPSNGPPHKRRRKILAL